MQHYLHTHFALFFHIHDDDDDDVVDDGLA